MNEKDKEAREPNRNVSGFTLIEIMIVVAIIGLLMGLVAWQGPEIIHESRVNTTRAYIRTLQTAVEMYNMNKGKYPQSLNDLASKSGSGGVKYLKNINKDPWKNEYVYKVPGLHGEEFSIISYGADGMEGGDGKAADIASWDIEEEDK